MKHVTLCLLVCLSAWTASAGDHGWKCDWFGIGCPEGEQNQVLMDLGRGSTNTGFLFFGGDTAIVELTLELTFSKRSILKKDKLYIQIAAEGLPKGAAVTLDGKSCLEPDEVAFVARNEREQVALRWTIPPSGEDIDLKGAVRIRPDGFQRAGSMSLDGRQGRTIEMLRIQGEVDDDWHWSKRLTFWFWAIVLTVYILWKFAIARGIYPRFDKLSVELEVGVSTPSGRSSAYSGTLYLKGKRVAIVGSMPQPPSRFARHMNGAVEIVQADGLPSEVTIHLLPGSYIEPTSSNGAMDGGHVVRVRIDNIEMLHAQQYSTLSKQECTHYSGENNIYLHIKEIQYV